MARGRIKGSDQIYTTWDDYGRLVTYPSARRAAPPPPPPPEPTPAEVQAYHADTADAVAVRRGIPLADLKAVRQAIEMFATNRYRLSESTDIGQMDGLSAVYYGLATAGRSNDPFVERLMGEITSVFDGTAKSGSEFLRHGETGAHFYRSWDREGPGSFHKAIVEVSRKPHGFDLHIWQAYHGSKAEERLAAALGKECHLGYATYFRTFMGEGDTFAIPYDALRAILDILGSTAPVTETAAAIVAHQMARIRTVQESPREYQIPGDGPPIWIEIDRVCRDSLRYRNADLIATDRAITGPAKMHDNGRPYAVGLRLRISTDHTPDGDAACLSRLARLEALTPGLSPAHPR